MVASLLAVALLAAEPSMETLVDRAAQELVGRGLKAPLCVSVLGAATTPRRMFESLLSTRLAKAGLAPVAVEGAAAPPECRAWLRVEVEEAPGHLRARGDVVSTWVNFWSGASRRAPEVLLTLDVSSQAAPVQGPKQFSWWKWLDLDRAPLALAAGKGSTGDALWVAHARSVLKFQWGAGQPLAVSLEHVAPASIVSRDPLARFESVDGGLVLVSQTLESPFPIPDAPSTLNAPCGMALDIGSAGGAGSTFWVDSSKGCWLLATSTRVTLTDDDLRVFAVDHGALAPQPFASFSLTTGAAFTSASGDFDGDGRPDVAVGVSTPKGGGEIWLVREVAP